MAQSIQIVPKFSFPYVESVINDYTQVSDTAVEATVDNSIKQAYVVTSSKGIDNVWVSKTSRKSAEKTFGLSNFKKYGQPYMQALHVLDQEQSQVWIMRVMPENATYSNGIVSAYYKADTAEEVTDAHLRKFRIKLVSRSAENVTTENEFKAQIAKKKNMAKDSEGYTEAPFMGVRYSGRGVCGDTYSMRISNASSYEKEYGIKMYNFEVINSERGLEKEANYVGSLVTSSKYSTETTTLINDVLDDTEVGLAPIDVFVIEENIEEIYNKYIDWIKLLHADLVTEYAQKALEYSIPEDQMNGSAVLEEKYVDKYNKLIEIEKMIDETEESELPDLDEFDIIYGKKVATVSENIPGLFFPAKLTADVNTDADDYDEKEYTESAIIDFSSVSGLKLENGTNGYFDNPRSGSTITGEQVKWTYEDEVEYCMKKAYSGEYDKRILSPKRIGLSVLWDANYPFEVKKTMADLALVRNDCRLYLDCGIVNSLSTPEYNTLVNKYSIFNDKLISKDIHNYFIKEVGTNKKVNVTISYYLAAQYVNHIVTEGFHIPFVKGYCQLTGHVKDSLHPIIEEYNNDIKEKLYDDRFNYFECVAENVFQRAVQNTTQSENTDLLEESNTTILYTLKHGIETDIQNELYNFADETIRQAFVDFEKAKYANWIGTILESINIKFATSKYEFERSILHAYLEIVFRGLTKKAIVEIDINKRTYTTATTEEE